MSEELRWKKFPVLNDGFVCLVDWMGDDAAICDAARVSYGKGTKSVSDDRALIRYLMRHHHGTPLEMAEAKFLVRVPMDCWRQWIRHRTANVNEYSTRYSEAIDSQQATAIDEWRLQSGANKQGSNGFVQDWPGDFQSETGEFYSRPGEYLTYQEQQLNRYATEVYQERLKFGVAREQARKDLPLSTYTEAYWKCDLRNIFGFLGLRMDSHAQLEIRQYANVIGHEIIAKLFPLSWEAFLDYQLNAMTLSAVEIRAIGILNSERSHDGIMDFLFPNKRERAECEAKLKALGFINEEII